MKSVLITGASSGFGERTALALAEAGWTVFAAMRDVTKGDGLLQAANAGDFRNRIRLVALDVTDEATVRRAASDVLAQTGGGLDALMNNAGYGMIGAFEDLSDEDCRRQMDTNFFGALAVTRAFLPAMRAAGRGRIVIVTSNAVNAPHPLLTLYAASKWALEGWAEGLAMELAPFGVEVVVVQPGAHRTPFAAHTVPVVPEGSAYARWFEQAAPGFSALDAWGRDPEAATRTLVDAVAARAMPFRTALGEDSVAFATMKAALPYETRAWALRAIVGLPQPDSFRSGQADTADADRATTAAQVMRRVADTVISSPRAAADFVSSLAASSRRPDRPADPTDE